MRVTQGMLTQQFLLDLQNNYRKLSRLQDEAASGKRINRPADDPVGVGFAMRYKAQVAYYGQYQQNADMAKGWLDYTDTVMNQAGDVIKRARDLAVQGASDTVPPDARQALASEVDQLLQQMVTIGNSQYNGKYIFNGQATTTPPYDSANPENSATNNGQVLYDIGDGVHLDVNVPGSRFFGAPSEADNVFAVLKQLRDGLTNNNTAQIEDALGKIDSRYSKMLEVRADVGARSNRVDLAQNRLADMVQNLQSLLSKTEDADMGKLAVDLKTAENVHMASLAVGARVLVPSLVDFLK
ncbi:flagellar hook-associated protein FlgL [Kyrpidia spormannii]|uniref:Flagellar biosynthesis protein FlgL n=1 Tax=Kyrpidia spormannii TaxID=2055160 RepID=A0ACA8ZCI3_9BACL|nr:flagellar hook-associated protein FlgL [Kyrpidia spormannii]CAB3395135.1 Flagellar biosynthesis protein FlgL [Kyrpidia spormannii]